MPRRTVQPKTLPEPVVTALVLPIATTIALAGSLAFTTVVPAAAVTDVLLKLANRRSGLVRFSTHDGLQVSFDLSRRAFLRA